MVSFFSLSLPPCAYLLPLRFGHFGLAFRSGGVVQALPINLVAFWLVLAVGGIVILVELIAGHTHK